MEKIIQEDIVKKETITYHEIYCDECGKLISKEREYDDGYYYKPNTFKFTFCSFNKIYKLRKSICNSCFDNFIDRLNNHMESFGFREEED